MASFDSDIGETDEYDYVYVDPPEVDYSIFTGGMPTTTPTPLATEVYVPAGVDQAEAIASGAAGMNQGESRVFHLPDGSTQTVIATAGPPPAPDLSVLYKIGAEIVRYAVQQDAQAPGGVRVVPQSVARVGGAAAAGGGKNNALWIAAGVLGFLMLAG